MDENNLRSKPQNITIFDIAREAGVSTSTVSRVLSGYVTIRESTRERVIEAANRLGYVANPQARRLAGARTQIIGVLLPNLDSGYGYIGEVMRGIELELDRADYNVSLYTTRRHSDKELTYVKTIANGLADGLLLVVPANASEYLAALRQRNFPYVLIDQGDSSGKSSIVDSTNWQGAYDATRFLIELGHRRIGFITGLMEIQSAVDRLEGYRSALAHYDIPFAEELIIQGDFLPPSGHVAAQCLLDLPVPPTAIFASNDFEAVGAIEAIRERGLKIPDDISIIGFDNIPLTSIVFPKLTTVQQQLEQMGRMATHLLLEQIAKPDRPPRRITLATQLIVRDSCRSIREI